MIEYGTMTQNLPSHDENIDDGNILLENRKSSEKKYGNILPFMNENQTEVSGSKSDQNNQPKQSSSLKTSNLFKHLQKTDENEDNFFQICDEGEEVNFGQSAANLEIRGVFTQIRIQLQKLMNEEQISVNAIKTLPSSIQDDFLQFTTYLKEKLSEIRNSNEISFINASAGKQSSRGEDLSLQFPQLLDTRRHSEDLARILQQKQALITNLMSQKTYQEQTINQLTFEKEELEQENENRFMNQCNVYKREIKELKKSKDLLQMNFQSLKNIIKNLLQAICDDDDMEDDVQDNLLLFARIAHLNEKQKKRLNYYVLQYRKMKKLE